MNWQKIAGDRLKELRRLRARDEFLRLHLQAELHRAVSMHLHAGCIGRAGELADKISVAVAEKLLPVMNQE